MLGAVDVLCCVYGDGKYEMMMDRMQEEGALPNILQEPCLYLPNLCKLVIIDGMRLSSPFPQLLLLRSPWPSPSIAQRLSTHRNTRIRKRTTNRVSCDLMGIILRQSASLPVPPTSCDSQLTNVFLNVGWDLWQVFNYNVKIKDIAAITRIDMVVFDYGGLGRVVGSVLCNGRVVVGAGAFDHHICHYVTRSGGLSANLTLGVRLMGLDNFMDINDP
ncbi:unnamed protein product [Allacma fusca]|uniref:Uncharacterized protein n=1 Tax=Allacma fusca TaxID=39272 RepID=A0A8J2K516_9HEXA|nr:unnamed protein product [Allacma fusca]